jgi:hypothetical protein
MSPIEAKSIIDALGGGIDPATGEVITGNSIFNQPEVIRALFVASKALEKLAEREKREKLLPSNAGKAWTDSEDAELLTAYDERLSVKELAIKHGRTEGAIESRLLRLGRT